MTYWLGALFGAVISSGLILFVLDWILKKTPLAAQRLWLAPIVGYLLASTLAAYGTADGGPVDLILGLRDRLLPGLIVSAIYVAATWYRMRPKGK